MRMHVPLATLGTLLDLPAGVSVVEVHQLADGTVELQLEGVQLDVDGELVTAEYSVDGHGHRGFLTFKAPEAPAPVPEAVETPATPTEVVGAGPGVSEAIDVARAGAGRKAGS